MATLYVGTSDGYYATIDAAVKAAAAGDTIIVKGDEYTGNSERVRVDKSLTLKAEGDVTLRGLNIGGKDFDLVVDGFNFVADAADRNGVTGYADNASCIAQVGTLRNVTVENCTFDLTNADTSRTYGMYLSLGTWGFENLVVRNNVCNGTLTDEDWSGYGLIYAANVNNAEITGNTVTNVAANAIQLSLTGKTYQGSGEQTINVSSNVIRNVSAAAVYCADLHNSDMTVAINDNIVSDVQQDSIGIYSGALRIGAATISGVEITGNLIEGAQVGIYNGAAIKEGSNGEINISNNAIAVSQIHEAEEGISPEFSGFGGTAIPEGTADANMVVEGTEIAADTSLAALYVNGSWSALSEGSKVAADGKVVEVGTNAFGSFVNVIGMINEETEAVVVAGDVTEDIAAANMIVTLSQDLEIRGKGTVTLNNGGYKKLVFAGADVKIAGVELVAPRTQVIFGIAASGEDAAVPANVEIAADALVSAYVTAVAEGSTVNVLEGGKFFSTGEVMNVQGTLSASGNAAFDAKAEDLTAADRQVVAHYMWDYGTTELKNNYSTVYSQLRLIGADSEMTLNNARLEVGKTVAGEWLGNPAANGVGWIKLDGAMTLDNDSVLLASGATGGYGLTLNSGSEFTVANGSEAEFGAGISNKGTIAVDGGTLKAGTEMVAFATQKPSLDVANSGEIIVSNGGAFEANNVSNAAVLTIEGFRKGEAREVIVAFIPVGAESGIPLTFTLGANQTSLSVAVDTIVDGSYNLTIIDGTTVFGRQNVSVAAGKITVDNGSFTADTVNVGTGVFAISGNSTVNAALIKGNDVTVSGTLKDSNITFETFDYETGNMLVDGEVVVDGGSFKNVQFRADAGEKVTLEGDVVAAGATQIKAVDGEVVVNGSFTGSGSTIEMEGDDARLTITENAKVDIAEGFFLNGGTTVITGTLADDADLTALAKDDAQLKGAYSTWGSTYAADVTLSDTYVWNAMISINNADTVVTLDNSRLTGWMSFDITGGTLTATNGSFIEHQAAEGWTRSSIGADAALVLQDGSTFNAAKAVLTNDGSITVDGSSFLTAKTLKGEGDIIVDVTGFEGGVKKIIDLSNTASLEGKVSVIGNENADAKVYYGSDGDVLLADAGISTFYVSDQYKGSEFAELEDGKFFGINAFDDINLAADMANDAAGKIIVDKGANVTYDHKGSYIFLNAANKSWTEGENAFSSVDTVISADETYDMDIDGTFSTYQIILNNGIVNVSETGRFLATHEHLRVMGGELNVQGNRAEDEVTDKADLYVNSWASRFAPSEKTQIGAGYLVVNQGGTMNFDDTYVLVHGGYINAAAGSTIDMDNTFLYIGNQSTYGANTITVDGVLTLSDNSALVSIIEEKFAGLPAVMNVGSDAVITIDATSSMVLGSINFAEGASITIDAADFYGYKKIIDLSGETSLEGKIDFTNKADDVNVIYGADGDVTLSNVSLSTIYVGTQYDVDFATEVAKGKFAGINAFASFADALALAAANASVDRIEIDSNIAEAGPAAAMEITLSKDLEIVGTVEGAADVDWTSNKKVSFVRAEGAEGKITLSFSKFDWSVGSTASIYFGNDDPSTAIDVTMDADCKVNAYLVRVGTGSTLDMAAGSEMNVLKEVFRIEGTLNAAGSETFDAVNAVAADRQVAASYARVMAEGSLNLTDTYMSSYSQFLVYNDVTLDNARMDIGLKVDGTWGTNPASNQIGWATFYTGAEVTLDNNSVMKIGGAKTAYGLTMQADANFTIRNGSAVELSFGIDNSGVITIADAELNIGTNFNPAITGTGHKFDLLNAGTVAVNGGVLNAEAVTNNGTVTVNDGTVNAVSHIANEGTITIDSTGLLTAAAIVNNGTITIDVKDYTGDSFKVIDVDSAITGSGTIKIVNGTNKYYLSYAADGDVTVIKCPEVIYVSSDYNSSTEGWGLDKFANYDAAVTFAKNNAAKTTIVIEKTSTLSGNCFQDKSESLGVDMTNAIIVKDGAVVGNTQSKWDMTYSVTIEAGGILQSVRPATAGYGNTHLKNKLVIGEAGAEKRAEVRFINGKSGVTYKTMSIALLSGLSRSITANNALIEVGDFGLNSTASFTDTILTIDGILAIKGTSLYKTTMTDTTVTVKGHNLMNENTYYSTVGTILATLTMDNTSIVVDDGVEGTSAEKVWLGYTGNTAQTLTMTNGSSITVEKGTEVQVANTVTVTDSTISVGTLNAGVTKYAGSSSFYFNGLEKNVVYYAVLYDAEGNELETIVRTSLNASTFYPSFSAQPAGDYVAKCFKDEAKTELVQEKTYSFTAQGTLTLTNSGLSADKLILAGNNLTMDYYSTVSFGSVEGGTVTVSNIADYVDNADVADGNYLIFDYTGSGVMTEADYKALLNNEWNDNYKVLWNDLYLTDQTTDTIYVNTEWAGAKKGDTVGNGYIYGSNAASSMAEIAGMINTDGSDTTVKFLGDVSSEKVVEFRYGEGDITFTADAPVTVKQEILGSDWVFAEGFENTITIGENVTFQIYDNASGLYVYYGPSLKIEGTVTGGQNWGCAYMFYGSHTVESTGTLSVGRVQVGFADLTVNGDADSDRTAAHVDTNYLLFEAATFTANNAIIEVGAVHDSNNGGQRYGASEFYINDSVFAASSVTLKYADSVFEVTGDSVLNIGTLTGAIDVIDADLTMDISGVSGSQVNVFGKSDVSGSISGSRLVFGSVDKSVEATLDVTGLTQTDFAAMNGSVTITGKMAEDSFGLAPMLISGLYNNNNMDVRGDLAVGATTVTVAEDAYVTAHQIYISETGAENKHVLDVYGEVKASASIFTKYNGELNVYGTVSANYLQVAGDVTVTGSGAQLNLAGVGGNGAAKVGLADGGSKFIISDGAKVDADGAISVGYSGRTGDMIVENATLEAAKVSVAEGASFTVKGESTLVIDELSGTMVLDNAKLVDSVISKGSVNIKGDNSFKGDFNASYAYVGDWTNESYTGSIDFGTASNVNVGGQMIIGHDYSAMGSNNVVFGDVTGAVVTDKVFKAADVSVRRDGTLTIANTTGDNKINTMNVMGQVVIDNAKLSGEVQIGSTGDAYAAEMTVKNGAEVALGGSSNSVVILGKSQKGTLNIDNASVTVKRCGAGGGYSVPADTFVIGYNGGTGTLNLTNNATFATSDYNGDKDGGKVNVLLNNGSISVQSGSLMDVAGTLQVENGTSVTVNGATLTAGRIVNDTEIVAENGALIAADVIEVPGTLTVNGASLNAGTVDIYTTIEFTVAAGEARRIAVSFIAEGASEGVTYWVDVDKNSTRAVYSGVAIANGSYKVVVVDGANAYESVMAVTGGTFDVYGESTLKIASIKQGDADGFAALRDGAVLTGSEVEQGEIRVYGAAALAGTNTLAFVNAGKGYEGAEKLTVSGTASIAALTAEADVLVAGTDTAVTVTEAAVADMVIDGAAFTADTITVDGTLELINGAQFSASDLTLTGTITVDSSSAFSFDGTIANSGSIYFAVAEGSASRLAIDYTGSETIDLALFGNITTAEGYTFQIIDNDLYVIEDVVMAADTAINAEWAGSEMYSTVAPGRVYGINAWSSLDEVAKAGAGNVDTVSGIDKLIVSGIDSAEDLIFENAAMEIALEDTELQGTVRVTGAGIELDADSRIDTLAAASGVHLSGNGYVDTVTGFGRFEAEDITLGTVNGFALVTVDGITAAEITLTDGSDTFSVEGSILVDTIDFLKGRNDVLVLADGAAVKAEAINGSGSLTVSADLDAFDGAFISVSENGVFANAETFISVELGNAGTLRSQYILVEGITEFNGFVVFGDQKAAVGEAIFVNSVEYDLHLTDGKLTLDIFHGKEDLHVHSDLNGNDVADILITDSYGSAGAWLVGEDGSLAWKQLYSVGQNSGWNFFDVIDTNNDDFADVILYNDNGTIGVWEMQADGSAVYDTITNIGNEIPVVMRDFDGDGAADLLTSNQAGDTLAFRFADGKTYVGKIGEWDVKAVTDLDGNGVADVILQNGTAVGAWLMGNDGQPSWWGSPYALSDERIAKNDIAGAGDFDGNGVGDILISTANADGSTSYGAWMFDNARNIVWRSFTTLGADSALEGIDDYDGDGKFELRIRTGNEISILDLGVSLDDSTVTVDKKVLGSVSDSHITQVTSKVL